MFFFVRFGNADHRLPEAKKRRSECGVGFPGRRPYRVNVNTSRSQELFIEDLMCPWHLAREILPGTYVAAIHAPGLRRSGERCGASRQDAADGGARSASP